MLDFTNAFVIIFLIGTAGHFILNQILEGINYSYRKKNGKIIPQELKDYLDKECLEKTNAYKNARYFTWVIEDILKTILFLTLIFTAYYNFIYIWLWRATFNPYLTAMLFFFFASLPQDILSIPFDLYREFVIEKKFGFSTTSFGLYLRDALISLIFNLILGAALICAMTALLYHLPSCWWILLGAVYLLLSLGISFIYPVVIAPLFNKFTPVQDKELKERIENLMQKSGFKANGIFIMDASKRSKHSNAYFTGLGKNKRIVLYDTLLEKLSVDEIEAVLGHELGHYKHKHVLKRMLVMVPAIFLVLFALNILISIPQLYTSMGFTPDFASSAENLRSVLFPAQIVGVFIAFLIFSPYMDLINLIANSSSRKDEFEADAYSKKICGSGQPLISALIKLNKENLSQISVPKIYSIFNYDHPQLLERINALK